LEEDLQAIAALTRRLYPALGGLIRHLDRKLSRR